MQQHGGESAYTRQPRLLEMQTGFFLHVFRMKLLEKIRRSDVMGLRQSSQRLGLGDILTLDVEPDTITMSFTFSSSAK